VCADEFGIPAFPIDVDRLEEYIVRLMAVDETNPDYESRKGSTIRKMIGALRIYEEQHPETSQVLELEVWPVKWLNLRSRREFRANPMDKKPFAVALAIALFLAEKEVDDDLYDYMALLRASSIVWMRGGEAANLHRSDITVICEGRGEARVVKEMIFRIRGSRTDIDGERRRCRRW
jgi:hypothetical protein